MSHGTHRRTNIDEAGGPGVQLASISVPQQEAYRLRERPDDGRCLDCGAPIKTSRLGKRYFWRCSEDESHTGSWEDGVELATVRARLESKGPTSAVRAVLRVLREASGFLGTREVSEMAGLARNLTWNTLDRLYKKGKIQRAQGRRGNNYRGWVWRVSG